MPTPQTQTDPRALSSMLEFQEHQHTWSADDLRAMVGHQLAAPLHLSLGALSAEVSHQIRQIRPALNPLLSLDQLLRHEQPPLELLKLVKRFAKICMGDQENPLPSEIVMVLYYASIAAALVRLGKPITRLPVESLRHGMSWLLDQRWLTQELRNLLNDALAHFDAHGFQKPEDVVD
jgi:hypothetical protein